MLVKGATVILSFCALLGFCRGNILGYFPIYINVISLVSYFAFAHLVFNFIIFYFLAIFCSDLRNLSEATISPTYKTLHVSDRQLNGSNWCGDDFTV